MSILDYCLLWYSWLLPSIIHSLLYSLFILFIVYSKSEVYKITIASNHHSKKACLNISRKVVFLSSLILKMLSLHLIAKVANSFSMKGKIVPFTYRKNLWEIFCVCLTTIIFWLDIVHVCKHKLITTGELLSETS